ncbi:MAG: lipocalin-like domain protein [Acidobacteriaceae bacterium]|nr:lipocalin-like domain protein [Acidobacteriaceae bacterium]
MIARIVSLIATVAFAISSAHAQAPAGNPFVGTWKLIAADKILPDGTRVVDYGAEPHGLAIFTADGHYTIDVFRDVRTKFAAKDREKGTFEEYKEAQLSSSCSFGTYSVDTAAGKVTLHTDRSTYPNNDDTTVVRDYELKGETLSWRVSPRLDGSIPITVVRRIDVQGKRD